MQRLRFSPDLETSLADVSARLAECPPPLLLGTEHLLLALAAAEDEVGCWLREQGVDPDALESEIRRRYGVDVKLDEPMAHGLRDEPAAPAPAAGETGGSPCSPQAAPVARSTRGAREARVDPFDPVGSETPATAATAAPPFTEGATPASQALGVLRVVDAAANRAQEAMRVVEDYVRFILDDGHLTGRLKALRHELTAMLSSISIARRLAARETQGDVGTRISNRTEQTRKDAAAVMIAGFSRLQQSLRTLEEFCKVLDPAVAGRIERLRYASYTLQRAVEITRSSLDRLRDARLYVLIDGRSCEEEFVALASALVDAGVHVLQLRDKTLDDRRLLERARRLRAITASTATLLIVNDRPDLAVLADADGVHVGQEELCVKDTRRIVGPDALVGVSTHSIEQARQAVLDGANYIGCGPTFPSGTKRFERFPGLPFLEAVAREIRLPAFAIGGITADNLVDVTATGVRRVAVAGGATGTPDPRAAVAALLAALAGAESRGA